jgi:hypothetical protein
LPAKPLTNLPAGNAVYSQVYSICQLQPSFASVCIAERVDSTPEAEQQHTEKKNIIPHRSIGARTEELQRGQIRNAIQNFNP